MPHRLHLGIALVAPERLPAGLDKNRIHVFYNGATEKRERECVCVYQIVSLFSSSRTINKRAQPQQSPKESFRNSSIRVVVA